MAPSMPVRGQPAAFQAPLSMPAETLNRSAFTVLMWALGYPGRRFSLPGQSAQSSMAAMFNSFVTIGATLLDLETTFFTPDPTLANTLARTGARRVEAESAAYHFYPNTTTFHHSPTMLARVAQAQAGTLLYPDQAATLIIGCRLGVGLSLRLSGPGIAGVTTLSVSGLPSNFWQLRDERIAYPLGWDLFLVDGDQIVGLPRTTVVEVVTVAQEENLAHK